jgi:hypothetical protein
MLCEGSFPRKTLFSLATQMRYQAIDHNRVTMLGRSAGAQSGWSDTVLFSNYKRFRREY